MVILSSPRTPSRRAADLGLPAASSRGSTSMMQPRSASTHSKISSMIRCSSWSMSSVWLTARAVRYMTCSCFGPGPARNSARHLRRQLEEVAALLLGHRVDDVRLVAEARSEEMATLSLRSISRCPRRAA